MSILPNWLTGYDEANAQAAAAADEKLRQMAADDYGPGGKYYSPENWVAVQENYKAQGVISATDQQAQIDKAFTDKLSEQAGAIIGTPLRVAWATIWAVVKSIPVWVWIAAAIGVFVWMGGLSLLKGRLAKVK